MKFLVQKKRLQNFTVSSCATSREEIGNDMHPGAKQKLMQMCIPFTKHAARQLTADDYDENDYLIAMDYENLYYINRIIGSDPQNKVHLLLEYAPSDYCGGILNNQGGIHEIADPWYTGNFDDTFNDILTGCTGLLDKLAGK